jgi:hypothetical protein
MLPIKTITSILKRIRTREIIQLDNIVKGRSFEEKP